MRALVLGLLPACLAAAPDPEEPGAVFLCEESAHCIDGYACINGTCQQNGTALTCATYCDRVAAACSGADRIYADDAACTDACALMPTTGSIADTSLDTLQCRYNHARGATDLEPAPACRAAALQGNGICGTRCGVYCRLYSTICKDFGVPAYADDEACMISCADFPLADVQLPPSSGNSVECRITHLVYASVADSAAQAHCPHTQETPTPPCAD
jgi:hypothetical protein